MGYKPGKELSALRAAVDGRGSVLSDVIMLNIREE